MDRNRRMRIAFIRQFICLFAPLLLLLGGGLFFLYSVHDQRERATNDESAWSNVRMADRMLRMELAEAISDLQWLATCQEAVSAVDGAMTAGEMFSLIQFMRNKRLYDRIRYMDITGMELFRVSYNDGEPYVARPEALGFLGNTDYMAEGLKLMAGDIYISPFDLQAAGGRVERPLKPVIRFATPVTGSGGARKGLVVVNYLGRHLLDVFDNISGNRPDCLMLLNDSGYWLKCPKPEKEWGFMLEDRRAQTFQAAHADAWAYMKDRNDGQFMGALGLYTFATIRLAEVIVSNSASRPEHAAGSWKIVSFTPRDGYSAQQRRYAAELAFVGGIGALFLAAVSLFVVHFRQRSRTAELSVVERDASFARFVPTEFLRLVGKGSLMDVELSTCVQQDLTVLFSDIRSYTTLSEGLTHLEVFSFLNDYFVHVSGPVTENGGFIDIFIGDAFMALFPGAPDDALRAAVAMRRDLHRFNEERRGLGMPPVHCGYGLHFGGVTLGTIGTPERMQTTAIGDTVNLASRIESVTKVFKTEIVVSQDVYSRLADQEAFGLREIDTVRVKGKHEPVTLYECYDADPPELAACKAATGPTLAEALALYKKGDFDAALERFTACAEACPEDSIPPIYVKRCSTMKRIPPGEGWAGISTL